MVLHGVVLGAPRFSETHIFLQRVRCLSCGKLIVSRVKKPQEGRMMARAVNSKFCCAKDRCSHTQLTDSLFRSPWQLIEESSYQNVQGGDHELEVVIVQCTAATRGVCVPHECKESTAPKLGLVKPAVHLL